jgi:hypothetical protein
MPKQFCSATFEKAVEIPSFVCTWSKCKNCKKLENSQNSEKKDKTRVQFQNASKIGSRIADASISDELRRILVRFQRSSIFLKSNWSNFFDFGLAVTKILLLQEHYD